MSDWGGESDDEKKVDVASSNEVDEVSKTVNSYLLLYSLIFLTICLKF